MKFRNTHFAIATHVLTALAVNDGRLVTSAHLAGSVSTNPAFLRGVLSRLREAGLISTKLGNSGGSTLARPPAEITLLDVFRATEGEARIAAHDCAGTACALGRQMPGILARLSQDLDGVLSQHLAKTNISDIAAEVAPTTGTRT